MSITNDAKNLPAASLITVSEVGVVGRVRDHFPFTAPVESTLTGVRSTMPRCARCARCPDQALHQALDPPLPGSPELPDHAFGLLPRLLRVRAVPADGQVRPR